MIPRSVALLACPLLLLTGATAWPGDEPRPVAVSKPVQRNVVDHADFTGRTAAAASVEIRARVTGYLVKTAFREGAQVRQGDLLFEIDPRPYQIELDQAVAHLTLGEARRKRLAADLDRARKLTATGAISREELVKLQGDHAEAEAALAVAKAGVAAAQLKLSFTQVRAPTDGVIGRSLLDPGNLVRADETALAHVVTPEPMHVYFELDERTLLQFQRALTDRKPEAPADKALPVQMGLAGDEGHPHQGTVDFVDNRLNAQSGTIMVRAVFKNPRAAGGVLLMKPGMLARVRLPFGAPHPALLVSEQAVRSIPGGERHYVLVVGPDSKLERRPVIVGSRQDDGLRVITKGIQAEDQVVVIDAGQLLPGTLVRPMKVAMPTKGAPAPPAK